MPLLVRPWSRLPATGHPSVRGRLLLDGRPLVGQPVALVPFWDETRFDWKFDSFALTCGYRAVRTDAEGRFNFAELGDPMAELLLRFDHPVILENQHRDWIRLGDGRGPDIDLGTFRLTEP